MKLLIVGSGGRLGAALCRVYAKDHEVTGLNHSQLDLGSRDAIHRSVGALEFDALVNCAALTNVDYCETHEEDAMRVNSRLLSQKMHRCQCPCRRKFPVAGEAAFGRRPDGHVVRMSNDHDFYGGMLGQNGGDFFHHGLAGWFQHRLT